MGKIIGIDLGTTNSCVAVLENGNPVIIHTGLGSRFIQSAVRVLDNGEVIVGENAYRARILDPQNTITSIKRFIGRHYNEVFDIATTVPYNVIPGSNNLAMVEINGNEFSPQTISAMILQSLKSAAETYLGQEITEAVITIPAYFNEAQRQATKEAGEMCGLIVRRIINEPTAAALAYGYNKGLNNYKIAVFDLGGGTFDITILELGEGVFEVKSISGDGFLGGNDFDEHIIRWLVEELELEYNLDISQNPEALQYIRDVSITAKCDLSVATQTVINIPASLIGNKTKNDVEIILTRDKFEEICEELFERLKSPCITALANAGGRSIDKVILVGGATRMSRISEIVKEIFGINPSKSVNPDEAVALGAAIQGAVMTGEVKDVLLLDVVKHGLGVETEKGTVILIIQEDTTIPTKKTETFSTAFDNQTSVEIHILQGNDNLAINNKSLGRFILENIPPAPSGTPKIDVTFDIDANAILHITAKDQATGKEVKVRIEPLTGLTKDEYEQTLPTIKKV
ncbi:MAG TPA: molecular chaperone DnaK [Chitinophagaceae bacterium]|nr:molecular chaperone DnaK [Chitinophagaceae bacterium]